MRSAAHSIRPKALGCRSRAGATARRIDRARRSRRLVAGEQREALEDVGTQAVRRRRGVVDQSAGPRDGPIVLVRGIDERAALGIPEVAQRPLHERARQRERLGLAERRMRAQQAVGDGQVVLAEAGRVGAAVARGAPQAIAVADEARRG